MDTYADILDSLEDLGYDGELLQEALLGKALEGGPESVEYTTLVSWLCEELRDFVGLQETVNPVTGPDDASYFLMEISSFLRAYGCPYPVLNDGPVAQRLVTKHARYQLLDFLVTELQAVRMLACNNPAALSSEPTTPSEIASQYESDTARHMKLMLIALGFPKPPANINAFQLFSKLEAKIKEVMGQHPDALGKPLLKVRLSDNQWDLVHKINSALSDEYRIRRDMLLKRLDVTIQSFMWSDKAKVSDRGGRAWELEPPPPEMPSFMKRQDAPQGQRPQSSRGGRGGRGGGFDSGGRGGKVQGGWDNNRGDTMGGNWNQGGGGYGRPQSATGGFQGGGGYQGDASFQGGGYQGGGGGYQGGGGGYQGGGRGGQQDGSYGRGGGGQGGPRGGRGGRGGRG
ncbi:FA98A-like protein, partial [Mya arenaria]